MNIRMNSNDKRQQIVAEARTWLGTPYHHQARLKGEGVDCAMILCEVFEAVGLVPHVAPEKDENYPPDWHFHRDEERYLKWIEQYGTEVAVPSAGDVALFQFGRCISHGAIVVEWPVVIHAYFREGCVLADASKGDLTSRVRKFYTLLPVHGSTAEGAV